LSEVLIDRWEHVRRLLNLLKNYRWKS
jgi:hypothetical protein